MSTAHDLAEMIRGKSVVAITGAGISTDAGLPDYRGTGGGEKPSIDIDMFLADPRWQRWVWQRNQETWRAAAALTPTLGHEVLARWEAAGMLTGVATQNVDGLHTKAGSQRVAEMHGSFLNVVCLHCDEVFAREEIDPIVRSLNPGVIDDPDPANVAILAAAEPRAASRSQFTVPPCPECGGLLKPGVVFFGEGVAAVDTALDYAREADVALVVGTSLMVLTGMWVVREAWATGSELAVINRGPTQADGFADLRIEGGASEVLTAVAERL